MAITATRFGIRAATPKLVAATLATRFGMRVSTRQLFAGPGFLAGQAPASGDPDEIDGRFRILNQPARGRIHVYERSTNICIASVMSNLDGTWLVDRLDPNLPMTVVGYDDTGMQNAAIQDWVLPAVED
jgi:hypothetical protein